MRRYTVKMLQQLGQSQGAEITDDHIVAWAQERVRAAGKSSGMTSFRDPSIATGVFLMDLVGSIQPQAVNWDIVTAGDTDDDKANNAKYCISVARKFGAAVFLTFEDIVEVKSKMIMTFVASIWATSLTFRA
jgi:plastin-1